MDIYEVYAENDGYMEIVPNSLFQTFEDAEAFAKFKSLMNGNAYTVCARKVNEKGAGESYTKELAGKAVLFEGTYDPSSDRKIIVSASKIINQVVDNYSIVDLNMVDTEFPLYGFSIKYVLKETDNTFENIENNLIEIIEAVLQKSDSI